MTANHLPKDGLTIAAFADPLAVCRVGIWKMLQRHPGLAVKVPDHTRKAGFFYVITDPAALLDMLERRTHGFRPGDRPAIVRIDGRKRQPPPAPPGAGEASDARG